ncbi:unnamed protein product [Pleuronectes platessa]|uniref:Uncharacterized protein n=1 Tax=Pleuronectes platessa TaxID=8262 RepID=A0A9N7VML8_PLEPL|nr:unnamed protein product [Pleuronectes platessa]
MAGHTGSAEPFSRRDPALADRLSHCGLMQSSEDQQGSAQHSAVQRDGAEDESLLCHRWKTPRGRPPQPGLSPRPTCYKTWRLVGRSPNTGVNTGDFKHSQEEGQVAAFF